VAFQRRFACTFGEHPPCPTSADAERSSSAEPEAIRPRDCPAVGSVASACQQNHPDLRRLSRPSRGAVHRTSLASTRRRTLGANTSTPSWPTPGELCIAITSTESITPSKAIEIRNALLKQMKPDASVVLQTSGVLVPLGGGEGTRTLGLYIANVAVAPQMSWTFGRSRWSATTEKGTEGHRGACSGST